VQKQGRVVFFHQRGRKKKALLDIPHFRYQDAEGPLALGGGDGLRSPDRAFASAVWASAWAVPSSAMSAAGMPHAWPLPLISAIQILPC
jgi:hypothetical protein